MLRGEFPMYDVLIIGCGIIGSAVAYELSKYQLSVGILEKYNDVANGATKANSAILHAGYDPHPGTDMARLNTLGIKLAKEMKRGSILINLSGRGDKDMDYIIENYGIR